MATKKLGYPLFMRMEPIVSGHFYHLYNRSVDSRRLFFDPQDFQRFYESLYLFNDKNFFHPGGDEIDRLSRLSSFAIHEDERRPFVRIASYSLIPNHFHILVQQIEEEGASQFMHKLCNGFSHYHNNRHERTGHVFEGPFKAKHVDSNAHLIHLPRYIHLNGLDLSPLNWRDGTITDWSEAERFLEEYPWTSHAAFLGKEQLLPVVDEKLIRQFFPTVEAYKDFLKGWSGRNTLPKEIKTLID